MKKEGIREVLAANLRALMDARGLSQAQLEAVSKVPQVTLSRILRANNAATIDSVEQIAAYFKIEPGALLAPNMQLSAALSEDERALLRTFGKFTVEARAALVEQLSLFGKVFGSPVSDEKAAFFLPPAPKPVAQSRKTPKR